ncbi:winged helix-turn-helix domain-containing protein [Methanosarcina sp. MSH10X1]|uniref:helix-turn-helix transcriptional regulator n=1 Tax=Methanosarcina sp. MSH10X1 TaxID=2507075 RepID=UPI001F0C11C4|nr:winged helix-turn-helix domain-containing protein [Methanosarcina sp. MSH10X1]
MKLSRIRGTSIITACGQLIKVHDMENTLLDLILLSEKRKNVLLLLLEGPKDIETIKKALSASATAVQPQVKKLKEQNLVVQEKNVYKLSEIGKVIAEKMKPLVDTLSVLEENADYWADREMSEIPAFLLRRIYELGHCTIIEPQIDHMFEMIPEYVKNARMAKKLEAAVPYFHPLFPSFYLEIAEKGIQISLILPESVLKRWVEDYREQTEQYFKRENAKLFVCKDCERTPAIVAADNFMAMALFPKSTVFDRKYVICFEPGALAWGKELYDYYEQHSEQIINIDNYTQAP